MTELTFSRLGPEDEDQLYAAIREILEENDTHNLDGYDQAYWKWQYAMLPSKTSYIYVGKNDEGKILAYYHIPIYQGRLAKDSTRYAMIQDVAVSKVLRGQGVFSKLATFANDDLDKEGIKLIYTFPNTKSIHTFIKYNNFSHVETFPNYIFPLDAKAIVGSKIRFLRLNKIIGAPVNFINKILFSKSLKGNTLEKSDSFTSEILSIYDKFQAQFKFGLIRDEGYLNWRYIKKPKQQLHIISLRNSTGELTATVILKEELIMNIPTLLLMDYAHLDASGKDILGLISLIRTQRTSLFDKDFGIIFITTNSPINNKLIKIGSFKLPNKLVPRPLNLLIRGNLTNNDFGKKEDWYVSLSDWDVL